MENPEFELKKCSEMVEDVWKGVRLILGLDQDQLESLRAIRDPGEQEYSFVVTKLTSMLFEHFEKFKLRFEHFEKFKLRFEEFNKEEYLIKHSFKLISLLFNKKDKHKGKKAFEFLISLPRFKDNKLFRENNGIDKNWTRTTNILQKKKMMIAIYYMAGSEGWTP